jgi:hypothetical protein
MPDTTRLHRPTYPLRLFFDCSTAHLKPSTHDRLERLAEDGEALIASTPYGWFVWIEEDPQPNLPEELGLIMDHARSLGAEYILFDRDASENPDLPIFEDAG